MGKWELARYFIDAKKRIDSYIYIDDNCESLSMLNIRQEVFDLRRNFYVECCFVLDNAYPEGKKLICKNPIIERIYYERDKDSAHKDANYKSIEYSSLSEEIEDMKNQLQTVRTVCQDFLPEELTIDYVSFDSKLFRLKHSVTKELEEEIWSIKYPYKVREDNEENMITKRVLWDTEDIRKLSIEERKQFATVFKMGLCIEESLQNLQDAAIRTNVLFGTNMWIRLDLNKWMKLREAGLLDIFDVPAVPKNKRELRKLMQKLDEIIPPL